MLCRADAQIKTVPSLVRTQCTKLRFGDRVQSTHRASEELPHIWSSPFSIFYALVTAALTPLIGPNSPFSHLSFSVILISSPQLSLHNCLPQTSTGKLHFPSHADSTPLHAPVIVRELVSSPTNRIPLHYFVRFRAAPEFQGQISLTEVCNTYYICEAANTTA